MKMQLLYIATIIYSIFSEQLEYGLYKLIGLVYNGKIKQSIISIFKKLRLIVAYFGILLMHNITKLNYYCIKYLPNQIIFTSNVVYIEPSIDDFMLELDSSDSSDSSYEGEYIYDTDNYTYDTRDKYIKNFMFKRYMNVNLLSKLTKYKLENQNTLQNKYFIFNAAMYNFDYDTKTENITQFFNHIKLKNYFKQEVNITNKLNYLISIEKSLNINVINKYINKEKNRYLVIYYTKLDEDNIILSNSKVIIVDTITHEEIIFGDEINFGEINI